MHATAACNITLKDDGASLPWADRSDDGANASIVSSRLAGVAVLKGIGRLKYINPVKVQMALKDDEDSQTFNFSPLWTVSLIILHLLVESLALLGVTFLVADNDLAENDLLIGLPMLEHLVINSKTILENKKAQWNDTDCSNVVRDIKVLSTVGRIFVTRIKRVKSDDEIKNNNNEEDSETSQKTTAIR